MALIAMASLTACHSNNGDIGDLYATWNLVDVRVDGVSDPDYGHDVSWSFQSRIIWMIAVMEHEQSNEAYASWEWQDDGHVMSIDLGHAYLEQLRSLPWGTVTRFAVLEHTSDRLTLSYVNNTGETVVYYFKKLI